ncbi:hypothetical protein CK219_05990 [Mesorhizobium sp. WSM4313]|nr:hypothetical protein CK219_05990 [Mesorhizobium sp. WSM4313]
MLFAFSLLAGRRWLEEPDEGQRQVLQGWFRPSSACPSYAAAALQLRRVTGISLSMGGAKHINVGKLLVL